MSNKVIICGYGWLGGYLANALETRSLIATTRDKTKARTIQDNGITPVLYTLGDDSSALASHFYRATLVLNIPPGRKKPELSEFTQQMKALIDKAVKAQITHIVFISTTSVYGDANNGVIDETSTPQPETASAVAHVAIEQHLLFHATHNHCKVNIVRLAGLTGPDRHPINSLRGKTLQAGNKPVNLVHVHDVVAALTSMIAQVPTQKVFHLCSLSHPKRGEYYTHAAHQRNVEAPEFSDTELPLHGKQIDASQSWQALGITPEYAHPIQMI
ncbi:NAD-dependent epimerase/dehydratase family protein [Alteromonas australica]|uniref:NAD-dependent epimerase/dehydratase family protein n=1 Tax=Alteromonas australica TaxID=589873 RepID=UPI0023543072|nr:NAD-dependent epimerase/dehydratase family protein [Alteromonas australica]|tara:strand:- start:1743 stop:2558 length:816 start_codon:yes stop_codon:yes gene_type:complete